MSTDCSHRLSKVFVLGKVSHMRQYLDEYLGEENWISIDHGNQTELSSCSVLILALSGSEAQQLCEEYIPKFTHLTMIISPNSDIYGIEAVWKNYSNKTNEQSAPFYCQITWPKNRNILKKLGVGAFIPHKYRTEAFEYLCQQLRPRINSEEIPFYKLVSTLQCFILRSVLHLKYSYGEKITTLGDISGLKKLNFPADEWRTGEFVKILETIVLLSNEKVSKIDHLLKNRIQWLLELKEQVTKERFGSQQNSGLYVQNNILSQALEIETQKKYLIQSQLRQNLLGISNEHSLVEQGTLFSNIPSTACENEIFQDLIPFLSSGGYQITKIEKIVSTGQCSASWYDQEEHEFVTVLQGCAALQYKHKNQLVLMEAGNWVHIRPHCEHRVYWTSADVVTIWLAIFFSES